MPISISRLAEEGLHQERQLAKSLNEARQLGVKTAFLSHSHLDAQLVRGISSMLRKSGWRVYIDWEDGSMPPAPNRVTAKKIKDRIEAANYFLLLATPNSMQSRWCPWEIGYADGVKDISSIFIIPTRDAYNRYYGNEYLQLYRHIDIASDGNMAAWQPGHDTGGVRVERL